MNNDDRMVLLAVKLNNSFPISGDEDKKYIAYIGEMEVIKNSIFLVVDTYNKYGHKDMLPLQIITEEREHEEDDVDNDDVDDADVEFIIKLSDFNSDDEVIKHIKDAIVKDIDMLSFKFSDILKDIIEFCNNNGLEVTHAHYSKEGGHGFYIEVDEESLFIDITDRYPKVDIRVRYNSDFYDEENMEYNDVFSYILKIIKKSKDNN